MTQQPITLAALATELGVQQSPAQPYSAADFFASFDYTLTDTYGPLSDDTEISAEDADAIREAWAVAVVDAAGTIVAHYASIDDVPKV